MEKPTNQSQGWEERWRDFCDNELNVDIYHHLPQIKAFIRDLLSRQRQELIEWAEGRLTASNLIIEASEQGQDLNDGYTPQERIDHELSAKAVLNEFINHLNQQP